MLKAPLMAETIACTKLRAAGNLLSAVPVGPHGTGTPFASGRDASDAQKFFTSRVSNMLTGSVTRSRAR